mgnify:CR=1 FL=1
MKQAPRWNEADHLTKAARDYERFLPYSRRENDQALLAPHGALQIIGEQGVGPQAAEGNALGHRIL